MSDLTYPEALAALQDRGRFGVRLGLGRTRAILRELGDPQHRLRGALVGGTNGKGSVLALAGAALRAAGLRVGETPKPHLITYRERLQVNGVPIDPATFARVVGEVLPVADRVARRHGDPTEFEILTAVVFRWFAEVGIDVALVEVGLGGRLDATHVWDGGVAAITNVDLDHTDRLGPTIAAIAREKAPIIERGDLAVTGATADALAVIRRRARRVGAPLTEVAPAPLLGWDRDSITVDLPRLGETRVGLRGRHQAANVAIADAVLDALEAAGIAAADTDARRRGYAAARWPGRLELLSVETAGGSRDVLLDGAHNPAGAAVLARALDDLAPFLRWGEPGGPARAAAPGDAGHDPSARRQLTLVMAAMADKDVAGIVAALAGAEALRHARIICTDLGLARSLSASDLAERWAALGGGSRLDVEPTPAGALERALREAPGPIVVAGSLYLVGEARARLVHDPVLSDPELPS